MSDYAPVYTTRERVRIALLMAAATIGVYLATHWWMVPAIENFARNANCYSYADFSGVELLFYGVFCGAPLSLGLLILLLFGRRCYLIFKTGQDPLPGEKTLRKRRYRYGRRALLTPLLVLLTVLYTVGVAIWGAPRAAALAAGAASCSDQQRLELQQSS